MSTRRVRKRKGLSAKAQTFVREYLKDLHGKDAAIRAGYSARRAYESASEMLARPEVQAAIAEAFNQMDREAIMSAEEVLKGYAYVAKGNLANFLKWGPEGVEVIPSDQLSQEALMSLNHITLTKTVIPTKHGESEKQQIRFGLDSRKTGLDGLAKHHDLWHQTEVAKEMAGAMHRLSDAFTKAYTTRPSTPALPASSADNGHAAHHTEYSVNGHSNGTNGTRHSDHS